MEKSSTLYLGLGVHEDSIGIATGSKECVSMDLRPWSEGNRAMQISLEISNPRISA